MLQLTEILDQPARPTGSVSLPIEQRVRSRARITLDDGREAGLFLPRGTLLRDGDLLSGPDGIVVKVHAADESVSTVRADDAKTLAQAAYHLGNRHVPLQVEAGWLRYQHDHVLDDMLRQMGLEVVVEQAPFEPEAGAYTQTGPGHHAHPHSHDY